jgi:hypothetical protein
MATFGTAKIGLGGGDTSLRITYDAKTSKVTVGYGTFFYNGKFFTTNDLENNKIESGIGQNNTFSYSLKGKYVYLWVENSLSMPQETNDALKMKIWIVGDTKAPNDMNITTSPLIDFIPLAFIQENEGGTETVYDIRPKFFINNFAFLGPGA